MLGYKYKGYEFTLLAGIVLVFLFILMTSANAQIDAKDNGKAVVKTASTTDTDLGNGKHSLVINSAPVRTYNGSAWLDFIKTDYVDGYYVGYTEIDKNEYIWVTNITDAEPVLLARVCMNVTAQNDNVELPLTKSELKDTGSVSNTAFYKLRAGETYCVWTDVSVMKTVKFGTASTKIYITANATNCRDTYLYSGAPDSNYDIDRLDIYRDIVSSVINCTLPTGTGTITDITLSIYHYLSANPEYEQNVTLHNLTKSFTEVEATWNNNTASSTWTTPGGDYDSTIVSYVNVSNAYQWENWTLMGTGAVHPLTYTWGNNINVILRTEAAGFDVSSFYSSEGSKPFQIWITYTAGGDTTKPQPVYISPTLTNKSYTANVSWIFVNASAGENISYCTLQNGTNGNLSMTANGQSCWYNYTNLANLTQRDFRVYFNDTSGNMNTTEWRRITVNLTNYPAGCTVTLANTTITNHANISCNTSDLLTLNWSWTQWDTKVCGSFSNITWYNYSYQACDYCTPAMGNTTHINHANISCNTSDILTLNWSWTQWDTKQCVPDNIANISWSNYTYVACDYCTPVMGNTTPVNHANISCNTSDILTLNWSWTRWDTLQCVPDNVANVTWYNYSYTSCDYCTPTLANTTQAAAQNTTCLINNTLTNWTWWVQWDSSVCVPDNIANITWYRNNTLTCEYCTPLLQNDTWSYEGNTTPSYSNGSCNSSSNLTQTASWVEWNWTKLLDFHACSGYSNTTIYYANLSWVNYTTLGCSYTPPPEAGPIFPVRFLFNYWGYHVISWGRQDGITDSTNYWLCKAADCSTTCQVHISGGLITGCV